MLVRKFWKQYTSQVTWSQQLCSSKHLPHKTSPARNMSFAQWSWSALCAPGSQATPPGTKISNSWPFRFLALSNFFQVRVTSSPEKNPGIVWSTRFDRKTCATHPVSEIQNFRTFWPLSNIFPVFLTRDRSNPKTNPWFGFRTQKMIHNDMPHAYIL